MTVLDRFLRYVQIDTQSDPQSTSNPSTEKQKDLGRVLVEELHAMGIMDAHLDEWGYVYATVPATSDKPNVPVICFCSHIDTAPDCSGTNVKPLVHKNYDGKDIVLPDDPAQVIRFKDHPDLAGQMGNDIVTASGNTLLGADNKAGLAEIMDAAYFMMNNPDVKHGKIRLLFTPDEEVGRGTDKVDIEKLGAKFGYTLDGETLGTVENETFSADAVRIVIHGVSTHPGCGKGKLEHAIRILAKVIDHLPQDRLTPETTEGKQGFIHPVRIEGILEKAEAMFIVRDFTVEKLHEHEALLKATMEEVLKGYPNSRAEFHVIEQYRNMKEILDMHPEVSEFAVEAIRRAGYTPELRSIRGGTDGSRLSFMGLPCPNIFAGEHAFHSKLEWVSVQDMEAASKVVVELAKLWEERA